MKVLDHGFVDLVDSMPFGTFPVEGWGSGDQRIVDAARVSIAGEGVRAVSSSKKLLTSLLRDRHTVPFEHVRFTFACKLPIFVARQWMRHRCGSFSEMSGRYGELPAEFYVPDVSRMQAQSKNNKQGSGEALPGLEADYACGVVGDASHAAYEAYKSLLAVGLSRELARSVLPVNTYTRFWWTVDLHNLFHFLGLRLHSHAQYEIRVYAEALLEHAREVAPFAVSTWEDLRK